MTDIKNKISIEKIKKWFERISKGRFSYDKIGIKPESDWRKIVIITTIVFCLEMILSCFIYFQIKDNRWFTFPENGTVNYASLNQNLLQKTVGQINAKNTIFSSQAGNNISDPSL